jgi:hypothetical protein
MNWPDYHPSEAQSQILLQSDKSNPLRAAQATPIDFDAEPDQGHAPRTLGR